ncbi:flagellar motor protein MotB [Pseudothermotoga thermarum]|uniref:OmpA/MotB domain protein n=1 Tax=Pseudothermotoga thermarum DSM 5069 TaxID=688269 RepID=F7YW69_9THEM|nr:flagellar motor protein MotB [Pseudothermotoga thermarum]AEH51841.1 OmpA/MotB domain protein [Pseudothermotoga thermarum DSM 5069]
MPRKKKAMEAPKANWLTTYSDMVTLLLTFFVLLFAMSTISPGKFQQIVVGLRTALTGMPPSVLTGGKSMAEEPLVTSRRGVYEELMRIAEEYKGKITIEERDEGTVIIMKDMAFFVPGSAILTVEAKELLGKIGRIIIEHTTNVLQVYGYADDQPLPPDSIYASNWHLSAARAASVVQFFTEELKRRRTVERLADIRAGRFDPEYFYDPKRFVPIGMGDWAIKNEIEAFRKSIELEKQTLADKLSRNEITYSQYVSEVNKLDRQFDEKLRELRALYRRIDILIKREKAK